MVHRISGISVILLLILALSGCAAPGPSEIAKPSDISLEQALKSVGDGLNQMYSAQNGLKTGLIPAEVTVTFNLGVSAKNSTTLSLDFSRTIGSAVSKAGLSNEQSSDGLRNNSVTIRFVNLLALPESSLLQKKSAAEISALLKALSDKEGGLHTFVQPPQRLDK